MTATLGEMFSASRGAPIRVGSVTVQMMLELPVDEGESFWVHWISATSDPPQGLRIKLDHGRLLVNGQHIEDVVLWRDTAPDMTEFRCEADDGGHGVLKVWNVWKDPGGIKQAWIGNSGMIISDEGSVIRLHCSHGPGQFDPTALVVDLRRGK